MTLDEYMIWKGLTDDKMAQIIGVSQVSVTRYRNGLRHPHWDIIERIWDATGGIVDANSFMRRRRIRRAA